MLGALMQDMGTGSGKGYYDEGQNIKEKLMKEF